MLDNKINEKRTYTRCHSFIPTTHIKCQLQLSEIEKKQNKPLRPAELSYRSIFTDNICLDFPARKSFSAKGTPKQFFIPVYREKIYSLGHPELNKSVESIESNEHIKNSRKRQSFLFKKSPRVSTKSCLAFGKEEDK